MPRVTKSTGLPIGTFKNLDQHPTIDGLVFRGYGKRRSGKVGEDWISTEASEARKSFKRSYCKRPEVRARKNELNAGYRAKDPQKFRDATKRWCARNPEKIAAKSSEYRKNHLEYFAAASSRRRSIILKSAQTNNAVDKGIVDGMYVVARRLSVCTGFGWDVDHIVPLSLGGSHTPNNLQVVPQKWNRVKKNTNTDKIKTL
jgi:5-methylcytosine-specific restriction endonuclease McrA